MFQLACSPTLLKLIFPDVIANIGVGDDSTSSLLNVGLHREHLMPVFGALNIRTDSPMINRLLQEEDMPRFVLR